MSKRERIFIIFPLQVRYKENLPIVLHGVSCTIPGGMKIGIVGRTGSGKSTLIQALFRLIEPAGGRIIIDNIDISTVGLHDLRSRLSIIPQEPTLFEGTIRGNLDPLEEHSDHTIWQVHSLSISDMKSAKQFLSLSLSSLIGKSLYMPAIVVIP